MNFKGTKGDWKVNSEGIIRSVDGDFICDCFLLNDDDNYNALLISKAPEMLEMLKRSLNEPFIEDDIKQLIKQATEI